VLAFLIGRLAAIDRPFPSLHKDQRNSEAFCRNLLVEKALEASKHPVFVKL